MSKIKYPYLPKNRKIKFVPEKDKFILAAKAMAEKSGCTKQATGAVVVKSGKIIGKGSNAGKRLEVCPRWYSPTGANYASCKNECQQGGHAEVTSLLDAKMKKKNTKGADLYLYGHWWCCKPCWDAMIEAGIKNVYLLENSKNKFDPDVNKEMRSWGMPKKSYILLDENISGEETERDVEYLLDLIQEEGAKKKRWEIFLEEGENLPIDGDVHSHSVMMECLSYNKAKAEGLNQKRITNLVWMAKFHDLGELKFNDKAFNLKSEEDDINEANYVKKNIMKNLKSEYAKKMLHGAISVSLHKENLKREKFDYVSYFNALERLGYLKTALYLGANKSISNWQALLSNVFYNQLLSIFDYGKRYKSVSVSLLNHKSIMDEFVEKYFTRECTIKGFGLIYGNDDEDFLKKEKNKDVSIDYINHLKKSWKNLSF